MHKYCLAYRQSIISIIVNEETKQMEIYDEERFDTDLEDDDDDDDDDDSGISICFFGFI